MAKIETINDSKGMRRNILKLLEELDEDNVEACIIVFERKGKGAISHYKWGNDVRILGLLQIMSVEIAYDSFPVSEVRDYGEDSGDGDD